MSNVLEVILNLIDNMTPGIESASSSLDGLEQSVDSASNSLDNVDSGGLDAVENAANGAGLDLQSVGEAASKAGYDISSINPEPVKETSKSGKDAANGLEEAAISAGLLEGALAAVAALGIVEYLNSAADAAGNRADEWARLNVNIGGTSSTLEQTKSKYTSVIKSIQSETKRGFGSTLKMLDQFAVADITNTKVMQDLGSAVSGTTFKLADQGATVDSVTSAVTRMITTGKLSTRQLKSLGITTEDLTRVTGMSTDAASKYFETLDTNGRAAFISNILNANGAKEGNKAYADSWEHLNDALGRAYEHINRLIGELILPIVIPVIELFTGALEVLAGGIDAIPPALEPIAGIITLVVGGFLSLWGILTGVSSALSLAGISFAGLGVGSSGVLAAMSGWLATLGPIGWAILAVVGAVTTAIVVWKLWSDEIIAFKDNIMSGNWGAAAGNIVDSFQYVGQAIYDSLVNAGQQIWTWFAGLPAWIGTNLTAFYELGKSFLEWIVKGLSSLTTTLSSVLTSMLETSTSGGGARSAGEGAGKSVGGGLIDGLIAWIEDNAPLIMECIALVFQQILPLIATLLMQLGTIVALYLWNAAWTAGSNFVNGLILWFQQLPGRIWGFLMLVLTQLAYWVPFLIGYGIRAGVMFVTSIIAWFSQLPGRIWTTLMGALRYIASFASRAPSMARTTGQRILTGLVGAITGLPGKVWNILMQIYNKLSSAGGQLYNAAVSLGKQIWDGFKDGLGIHSPSYLEKAIDAIIEKSHTLPVEMKTDAEALKRINWAAGSPMMDVAGVTGNGNGNTLNLNVDLTGTPPGNSDKEIAKQILNGIDNTKVLRKINIGLGKLNTNNRRSTG